MVTVEGMGVGVNVLIITKGIVAVTRGRVGRYGSVACFVGMGSGSGVLVLVTGIGVARAAKNVQAIRVNTPTPDIVINGARNDFFMQVSFSCSFCSRVYIGVPLYSNINRHRFFAQHA